jgi:outer membrane protein assembly factor BamB
MAFRPTEGRIRTAGRRGFLAGLGAAVAGCAAPTRTVRSGGTDAGSAGAAAVWPSFGRSAGNARSRPDTAAVTGDPTRAWRAFLDGNLWSAPTATASTVFSTGGRRVFALDPSTGEKRWTNRAGGKTGYFSPTVAGGRVFVGVQRPDSTRLLVLDAADGSKAWTFGVGTPVASYANVVAGTVYLETASDRTQTVWALDAATGETRWRRSLPTTTTGRVSPGPAVDDGRVYSTATADDRLHLYALDAATGEERWHRSISGRSEMSPVAHDGTVFVGNRGGSLHAYDAASGDPRWRAETDAPIRSNPAVTADAAYVGDALGTLYAVDRATGERAWTVRTQMVNSTPAVAGDALYTGGTALLCLDRASGERRWAFNVPTHSSSFFSPVPIDGSVFAGVCIKLDPKDPYDNYVYRIE